MFGVFFITAARTHGRLRTRAVSSCAAEGLTREFAAGATPTEVCARTMRALMEIGARHFYISNLPLHAARRRRRDLDRVGVPSRGSICSVRPADCTCRAHEKPQLPSSRIRSIRC
jgi:hypothetical protein